MPIRVNTKTYYVGTGTDGGTCQTRELANGGHETICRDGTHIAALSTLEGCLDSNGSGYCTLGRRRAIGGAGSELTCASGPAFFLLVGPEATCRVSQDEKTCQSPDGKSTATADCKSGCLRTTGAGNCCDANSSGCPPASEGAR